MRVTGSVQPPGDKSVTHRALIVGALSRTRVEIRGALTAQDAQSTAAALRSLGVEVGALRQGVSLRVEGASWRSPEVSIDCGNAGTTVRLLLGALAGQPVTARLTGEAEILFTFPTYPGGIYPAPDNTLLAVDARSTQKQTLEIIDLDGKIEDTLAAFGQGGIYIVSWSHNGEKIAFTVQSEPYTADDQRIYTINRNGTGLTELYRGIVIPTLVFSHDDRYLLFTDQERSLVSISLESLAIQKILVPVTSSNEYALYPSWQP